jgi:predicted nucleic acid-binding protein
MRANVLDANALYRFLTNGPGADVVAETFRQAATAATPVMMSVINFGEVYYTVAKHIGLAKADKLLSDAVEKIGLNIVDVNREAATRAARLKVQYGLPYADAFAAQVAGNRHVLVTSDYDHFKRVPKLRMLKLPAGK